MTRKSYEERALDALSAASDLEYTLEQTSPVKAGYTPTEAIERDRMIRERERLLVAAQVYATLATAGRS